MSRRIILALAAVATLVGTALVSGNADAMMMPGGHGGHGGNPGDPTLHPGHPHNHFHYRHWVRWHKHIWVRPVGYVVRDTAVVQPGPCTCLTKNYTPEGMVVFQDLCTKEMAIAPVDGASDQASAVQGPASYAGQTYEDYLKAHPEAKQPDTKKN